MVDYFGFLIGSCILFFPAKIPDENPTSMKIFHPKSILYFQGKFRLTGVSNPIIFLQKEFFQQLKGGDKTQNSAALPNHPLVDAIQSLRVSKNITTFYRCVKTLGYTKGMDEYERSRLGIFNLLNLFQLITGLIVPLIILLNNNKVSTFDGVMACGPAFVSLLILGLNAHRKYEAAVLLYFILHPFFTSVIYMSGMDLGIELCFILYGVFAVFFLQDITHMLLAVGFSMINYFMLAIVLDKYQFTLGSNNYFVYLFNELVTLMFIFYGLYLIKKENSGYQSRLLKKNEQLKRVNSEIQRQKKELTEINSLKNKLFSVISHDLKTPMYALHNLFSNIQKQQMPATEIKEMIPDVVNDLSYTMSLMENLLQWAKSQMRSDTIKPQVVDVTQMIHDVINLLRLPAEGKRINLENKTKDTVFVYADREMIHLVLRNLISNAVKFTPENGTISVGAVDNSSFVEIYVQDTGMGMTQEVVRKISSANYFTTKGTVNESGTGLGLMLCREFLSKSGGHMYIESEPGKGSIFSFTLPSPSEKLEPSQAEAKYGT